MIITMRHLRSIRLGSLTTLAFFVGCGGGTPVDQEAKSEPAKSHHSQVPVRSSATRTQSSSDFEDLLSGLQECKFKDFHLDSAGRPVHKYFVNRDLSKCGQDDAAELAFVCVQENYHGIPVYMIEMPLSTAPLSRGIHFDLPIEKARAVLKKEVGSEFRETDEGLAGLAPILYENSKDKRRSALICSFDPGLMESM